MLHKDLPHTHKPRDFTTRDDVEKKHWAPEPRSSPTLKLRPQRATPSAPKAVLPRPLRTSGTSRECDLLLAQPFPLMHGTASNPRTTRDGLRWRAKACSSWLWLSRHFGQTRAARACGTRTTQTVIRPDGHERSGLALAHREEKDEPDDRSRIGTLRSATPAPTKGFESGDRRNRGPRTSHGSTVRNASGNAF